MSRIGRKPIPIPAGVQVTIKPHNQVTVKGPKGELTRTFHPDLSISLEGNQLVVRRPSDNRLHRSLHGLTRTLLANMVIGVTEGFSKRLILEGTGYRASLKGNNLVLQVGLSHPVEIAPPPGVSFQVDKGGRALTVMGIDKEKVGETAARIRRVRPPEPYKGMGIRYEGEEIRRKAGKGGRAGR